MPTLLRWERCWPARPRALPTPVAVTLGTGVGGGIVIDGKLFTGFHYGGAELGHMGIVLGGRKCTCGRRGCLEAYASATGLIRSTKEAMDAAPDSLMWELAAENGGNVSGRTLFWRRTGEIPPRSRW